MTARIKFGFLAAGAMAVFSALQASAQQPPPPSEVQAHLRHIALGLPTDSPLRRELEAGEHGDGVTYPWMGLAKHDGVKSALVEINFTWHRGLHNLNVARVMFFAEYERQGSQITDSEQLSRFAKDGLRVALEREALRRALRGAWFVESPEYQHPPKKGWVPASTVIVFYDDPWLPLLPAIYVTQDSKWSPLEDASLMSDRVALRRLLAQGNLKRADLDKALFWAAGSDDPVPLKWLLVAGAHAHANSLSLPLLGAIWNSRTANVRLLLDAGANPNSKDAEGESALSIARRMRSADIAEMLEKAGAKQ